MAVSPLTELCAKTIVRNENLLEAGCKAGIPGEFLKLIKNASTTSKWNWFVTPLGDSKSPLAFSLTSQKYENFCKLYTSFDFFTRIQEKNYIPVLNQPAYEPNHDTKIINFVKENGKFQAIEAINYKDEKKHISLFGSHDRVIFAKIELPCNEHQSVIINIPSLDEINKYLTPKWSNENYKELPNFIIYFINQLAIDNSDCLKTSNRTCLANKAKSDFEAGEHLFGEYKGPSHWLHYKKD